jgi:enediyne biosynthesis protein E5
MTPPRAEETRIDPRLFQIASLSALLVYGLTFLGFDQPPANVATILVAALSTQWIGQRVTTPDKPFDPLSPLITALSLCLLLRTAHPVWLAVGAILAIGSKFIIRANGKHIFNPANFGIAVLLLCSECAWISPAQWGSKTWAVFAFASLAGLVLSKAKRADTALAFLGAYVAILLARALYLGDPLTIPMKQMQSGALLLFAFFMITDPKTTPDRRAARVLYAGLVACLGAWLQFGWYLPHGMMLALFVASPFVPLFDRVFKRTDDHARFQWSNPVLE